MMADDDGDVSCMLRLQGGDDGALNELMSRWSQPLANFLFRYTSHEATAIDLAQETFVRVYENRLRFRGGRFSSWLFSIAVNLARNNARWRKRHPAVSLDAGAESGHEIPDTAADPSSGMERSEDAAAVRDAIRSLPEDLRMVVLLFEYEEQSYAEIAAALGCTPKAVETRLYRARQLLRDKLRLTFA